MRGIETGENRKGAEDAEDAKREKRNGFEEEWYGSSRVGHVIS
jgi:hypothetical protein